MPPFVNFGVEFGLSLLVFSLLGKWYVWPFLCVRPFTQALLLLLSPFLLRYLGLMSLVPGVVEPAVTRSTFAFYQAYGDFLAFLLAFAAFVLVRSRHSRALAIVWVFTCIRLAGVSSLGGSRQLRRDRRRLRSILVHPGLLCAAGFGGALS
jgi:hypothetical protein